MRTYTWKFAIAALLLLLGSWVYCLFAPTVMQKEGVVYYLRPGTTKAAFLQDMSRRHIVSHPVALALYVLPQANTPLKTGEYLFREGSNVLSIWHQVVHGKGLYMRVFTIVPGATFSQIRKNILAMDTLSHPFPNLTENEVMSLVNINYSVEGQLYPESYYYTRGVQDIVLLKRAFDLMQNRLQEAWIMRAEGLPYQSSYEALIAASLIEKEVYWDDERPLIASVIVNRLKKNMLLQIDPTVIYGLGDKYTGKILKRDLNNDSLYNTYRHKGLPPTPIATPSMKSIEAALHPANTSYYYFVAMANKHHQFSTTLTEHNRAVAASQKRKISNAAR